MTAPDIIYLQVDGDKAGDGAWEGITWCTEKINDNDVEYIRADRVGARQPDERAGE